MVIGIVVVLRQTTRTCSPPSRSEESSPEDTHEEPGRCLLHYQPLRSVAWLWNTAVVVDRKLTEAMRKTCQKWTAVLGRGECLA
ncbi:hypothetical protein MHYP_G00021940 [Metynnis hypsauchen]